MAPKKAKKHKKAKKRVSGRPYVCPLCNKGFTRRATVKEPHFPSCVARHGNPNHVTWDAHQSCWAKRPGRKAGSSAVALGLERMHLDEDDEEGGARDGDGLDNEVDEEQDVRSSGSF